ncbi:Ig-like domain-containing protein [Leptolyngbya sp. PL-A3]|uniref:beta strand repeat-containing protein n=1 Tax=Leptolyngbya sp. PL-A3 TaxID=2933911 RepID=UPI00329A25FA
MAVNPIGPEFRVNSFTDGQQSTYRESPQAMAMDGDGDFVITWSSLGQDGSDYGIYAQRYNSSGVAQGSEFRVNTTTTNRQRLSTVAMDADGDFVVTWTSYGQNSPFHSIYAQRYNAAGVAQGSEFRVNTTTTSDQLNSTVAMDANGNFVVAWRNYTGDGSGDGIYAQRYDATGVAQGSEFKVNSFTDSNQTYPTMAMDGDGDFVVTWSSNGQDGSGYGVYGQRYNAAGIAQGGEFKVNSTTDNHQWFSTVAMDADGDFVVTWSSNSQDGSGWGVYGQRYNAAGVAQGGEFKVNTATGDSQLYSTVAMDADGDFVVTWSSNGQDGSGYGVYGQRYNAAGVAQGSEFRVNAVTNNQQLYSTVAMDTDGDFAVAWSSNGQDGSGFGIYAQAYDETVDSAGPIVAGVFVAGDSSLINSNERLVQTVPQLVVAVSEALAASATNPANWQLTRNGVDVSSQISTITFGFNATTNRYEATLSFSTPLNNNGDYILTAKSTLTDTTGNALDGDANGTPGGDFSRSFTIANPTPVGSELRINSFTGSQQRTFPESPQAMAMDADGDFVVTWSSLNQDGSGWGVYGQRYNAAGVAQGGEFKVNTVTNSDQMWSTVAMDGDGDFVITWSSLGQDGSGRGVYGQRYNAAGIAQGGEFKVNTVTSSNQLFSTVAMDGDGDFVVTWSSYLQDGSIYGVYGQRYNAAGIAQGGEFKVNTVTSNHQLYPTMAMDRDGDFVVTWSSNGQDGSGWGVYGQRYNAAGSAQGGEFKVNSTTTNTQHWSTVAMDADGDFVVTWSSYLQDGSSWGVYGQRYNAAGVAQGSEFQVNTATGNQQIWSTVAMDEDGDFVITWSSLGQDGSFDGVYGQRYNAAGVAQGGEFRVNTITNDQQRFSTVAMDADGDFAVVWTSKNQDGSDYGIYAQRYGIAPSITITPGITPTEAGATPGTFTITLNRAATTPLTVNFGVLGTAANPADYSFTPGPGITAVTATSFTLAAGVTTATLNVVPINDTIYEPGGETVQLALLTGTTYAVGNLNTATLTLTDNDTAPTVTLDLSSSSMAENGGVATVTATLSNASTQNVTVNLGLTGTASGSDYSASGPSIVIPAGSLSGSVTLTGVNDAPDETNETVILDITSVTNGTESGTQQATVTITDDDPTPTLSVGDVILTEGDAGTQNATFTVTLSAPSGQTVTVNYATSNGSAVAPSDYTTTTGTLTFAPGVSTQTITVPVLGDTLDEANETFNVTLTSSSNATIVDGAGVGTITDNDPIPTVSFTTATQSGGEGSTLTITLQLSALSGQDVTVPFTLAGTATDGSDYTLTTSPLTITAGSTTATLTLVSTNDALGEADETIIVTMGVPTNASIGATATHTVTLLDNDVSPGISLSSSSATTLNSSFSVTATFTETVTGFDASEVTITNGTLTSFMMIDAQTYTFNVLPTSDGTVTVDVAAATAQDSDGNGNLAATPLSRTFDGTPPVQPPAPTLTPASDTGVSNSDRITNQATPTLTGISEANSLVEVFEGTTSLGSTTADGSGNWSFTPTTAFTLGSHTISVTATDAVGNTSVPSAGLTFTVDPVAPAGVVVNVTPEIRDTSVGFIRLQFNEAVGNFELSDLVLTRNGSPVALVGARLTASADRRSWTLTLPGSLTAAAGRYQVRLTSGSLTDLAGNAIGVSASESWLTGRTGTALPPISGGQPGTRIQGTTRSETLRDRSRNDVLLGLGGNDTLIASQGNDVLDGGAGNDRGLGGAGNDRLTGGSGNDRLVGELGNDVLVGGIGSDTLAGNAGRDTFVYNNLREAGDIIKGFSGREDLIDLRPIMSRAPYGGSNAFARFVQYVRLQQVGADTRVRIDADGMGAGQVFTTLATLQNTSVSSISARNIVIA